MYVVKTDQPDYSHCFGNFSLGSGKEDYTTCIRSECYLHHLSLRTRHRKFFVYRDTFNYKVTVYVLNKLYK